MASSIMLSVVHTKYSVWDIAMLSVIMLNVSMLSVIMLSVYILRYVI